MYINLTPKTFTKHKRFAEFLKFLTTFIDNTHAINLSKEDKALIRQYFSEEELKKFYNLARKYNLILKIPKEIQISKYEYSTSIIPNPFNYYSSNINELLKARYRFQALQCKIDRINKIA